MKRQYYIENLTCSNCGKILVSALSEIKGVRHVFVKPTHKVLSVEADHTLISDEEILEVIKSRRYTAMRIINPQD